MTRDHRIYLFGIVILIVLAGWSETGAQGLDGARPAGVVIRPDLVDARPGFPTVLPVRDVRRPKVALVLSGGGARGIASIGVLKVFERHGIPLEFIVGTSIGSIVGGLYASGYSTAQLERLVDTTRWDDVLSYSNDPRRRDMFLDQKQARDRSVLVLRFSEFEPIIPSAFSSGQQLTHYLNFLVLRSVHRPERSFDDLKVRFRAVTTDLISGKQVVIDRGDLAEAMRAAVAVPLLFTSVRRDTLELLDGGLLSNLPVDVARQLGADIVIAVDVTSPLRPSAMLNVPWEVGEQIMAIMMQQANKVALERSDVVVRPDLENHLSSDFSDFHRLIRLGEEAAMEALPAIRRLLRQERSSGASRREFRNPRLESSPLLGPEWAFASVNALDDRPVVTADEVRHAVNDVYATGDYADVEAEVVEHEGTSWIRIRGTANPRLTGVEFQGIHVLNAESLYVPFAPLVGRPVNARMFELALEEMIRQYREQGFALARVVSVSFDSTSGKATIRVEEGMVHRIDIRGTLKTKDYVIWRELPWDRGEVFQISNVERGMYNLYGTGLFEQVTLSVHREGTEGEFNICTLNIRERSTELIRFGIRVDSERNFQPAVDLRDENFLGIGMELGFRAHGGSRNHLLQVEARATRIFNTYLTLHLKGYVTSREVNVYADVPNNDPTRFNRINVGEYREIKRGGGAIFGTQLERLGSVTIEGKVEDHHVLNRVATPIVNEKFTISSVKFGTQIDTQDKYPFPTDGVDMSFFYETASIRVGSSVGFTKMQFSYDQYQSILRGHVLHPRLQVGFGDATVPLTEQFSMGGQNSFFGFREDNARGRQLLAASLEYRYFIPFPILFDTYFSIRYDLGSIWAKPEEVRLVDLQHGVGLGVGFDTAIGPAEFMIGRSFYLRKDILDRPLSLGPTIMYFSIGYPL